VLGPLAELDDLLAELDDLLLQLEDNPPLEAT
jgi:hypothetical protein